MAYEYLSLFGFTWGIHLYIYPNQETFPPCCLPHPLCIWRLFLPYVLGSRRPLWSWLLCAVRANGSLRSVEAHRGSILPVSKVVCTTQKLILFCSGISITCLYHHVHLFLSHLREKRQCHAMFCQIFRIGTIPFLIPQI